jgi:hypothetical protein
VAKDKDIERCDAGSPASVALYIGAIAGELGHLAKANGFDALSYLLDMARLETDEILKFSADEER